MIFPGAAAGSSASRTRFLSFLDMEIFICRWHHVLTSQSLLGIADQCLEEVIACKSRLR